MLPTHICPSYNPQTYRSFCPSTKVIPFSTVVANWILMDGTRTSLSNVQTLCTSCQLHAHPRINGTTRHTSDLTPGAHSFHDHFLEWHLWQCHQPPHVTLPPFLIILAIPVWRQKTKYPRPVPKHKVSRASSLQVIHMATLTRSQNACHHATDSTPSRQCKSHTFIPWLPGNWLAPELVIIVDELLTSTCKQVSLLTYYKTVYSITLFSLQSSSQLVLYRGTLDGKGRHGWKK